MIAVWMTAEEPSDSGNSDDEAANEGDRHITKQLAPNSTRGWDVRLECQTGYTQNEPDDGPQREAEGQTEDDCQDMWRTCRLRGKGKILGLAKDTTQMTEPR